MRLFFSTLFGLLLGCNLIFWACLSNALSALGMGSGWQEGLGVFMVLQIVGVLLLIGGRVAGGQPGSGMGRAFLSLTMIWNMLLLLPVTGLALVWAIVHWLAPSALPAPDSWGHAVALAIVVAAPALALAATLVSLWQLGRFRVLRMDLSFPSLPPALDGLTIAHVSDLHVGKLTTAPVLEKVAQAVNRLDPDLVLVTGDLINMAMEDLPRAVATLKAMTPRHGLFLCEGNHDLIEDAAAFEAGIRAAGIRLLLNEAETVSIRGEAVRIIGLRWGEGHDHGRGRKQQPAPAASISASGVALQQLLAGGGEGTFPIVLAHHPDAFDIAAAAGVPLTLAGHTHGGQLNLNRKIGFGPSFFRYWSGLYRKGVSALVVSNGTGNWFPLRMNAPAEIVFLTLRCVDSPTASG